MKVKKSVLSKIFRRFRKGFKTFKNNISKFKNLLFYNEEEAIEYGEKAIKTEPEVSFLTASILEDKSNLFYSVYDENEENNCRLISYKARMMQYELERKEEIARLQKEAINNDDVEIDICEGTKYIVRKTIKSIYLKAKDLYVTIDGYILKTNRIYRECIEAYRYVRDQFKKNYNQEILNNDVLYNFVRDNAINLNDIRDNFEILLKLFIADVYTDLYNGLVNFSRMFENDIYVAN